MLALILAATIGQLPILPPLLPDENSKADVATLGYIDELNRFYDRVQRRQREIEAEPDEQRRKCYGLVSTNINVMSCRSSTRCVS